jgi:protein-S-isoprenylcysteine O-methyltransferase Ste14
MFVLVRAIVYATFFIGFFLIFVPRRLALLELPRPERLGVAEVAGIAVGTIGVVLAVWCVLTFVFAGRGTPAPFDPPRRLVVRGPYRVVRNPMYLGAALLLAGSALFHRSLVILAYAGAFLLILHFFVVGYEEPALRRTFGADYEGYRARVSRWLPSRATRRPGS